MKDSENFISVDRVRDLDRYWISDNFFDKDYISPQIGDVNFFVAPAYEKFVATYYQILNFHKENQIWPWEKVDVLEGRETKVKVVDIKYEFPELTSYKAKKKFRSTLTVILFVKCEIIDPAVLDRLGGGGEKIEEDLGEKNVENKNIDPDDMEMIPNSPQNPPQISQNFTKEKFYFWVKYFPSSALSNFFVPEAKFEAAINDYNTSNNQFAQITTGDENYFNIEEVTIF